MAKRALLVLTDNILFYVIKGVTLRAPKEARGAQRRLALAGFGVWAATSLGGTSGERALTVARIARADALEGEIYVFSTHGQSKEREDDGDAPHTHSPAGKK